MKSGGGIMRDHPYKKFENSPLWKIVESSIIDLVNNQDLEEKTMREYIVGYIVSCIDQNEKKL